MALSKPFGSFVHRRTVRLITDPEMEIDSLKVVEGLPDFSGEICGIVPVFGGRAFDITLKSAEAAAKLAANGFPYGEETRPLTLLGVKTVHVSVFVSVEFPDEDLVNILKVYGDLKSENLRRLTFKEAGFTHIENGVRVAQFTKINKDIPRKLVVGGVEIGFKYSGQPTTCYRCHSTEHVVKNCPKLAHRKTLTERLGGTTPVLPPPPLPPVVEEQTPAAETSQADQEEDTPSGNATPSLFSESEGDDRQPGPMDDTSASAKRKTPPANSDSEEETAKKPNRDESSGETTTSSPPSAPPDKSYKLFINAMKSSGWERSKLMTVIPGVCYYRCRGLYLQHSHGDHSKDKARSVKPGDRDSDNWKAFKGTIQQDAFARLLQEYKDLRARYHIFPNA